MCGIAGFLDGSHGRRPRELEAIVSKMAGTIAHRGPDDGGVWTDSNAGVALGHRRLAILDLSAEGHQPMPSPSGRYVMTFNGEIYNYRTIRAELEATLSGGRQHFRGSSDTEVMLAAFERWGIKESVIRFNGMFAFAVWDRKARVLTLVRDRIGEKPLYYGWMGNTFLFGSELKSLRVHPSFQGNIDHGAVALLLRYGYVPSPYSIYAGMKKLPPASILTVDAGNHAAAPAIYWSAKEVAEQGCSCPISINDQEAVERLESILSDSIKLRMVSDVPVGAFLSGGIDSSTVVALMQKYSSSPVKTFTIGFREAGFDEAKDAERIARHLGVEHTELYVTPSEAMSVIQQLPRLYDEPFGDSSQVPTFLVSRLARRQVTVSLSGDGGDEVFGGYTRYSWGPSIWRRNGWLPTRWKRYIADSLTRVAPHTWDRVFEIFGPLLPTSIAQTNPGDKLHKLAKILKADSPEAMYRLLVSHWYETSSVMQRTPELPTLLDQRDKWANIPDLAHKMMFLDTVTYLPDDILVKLDRASMGVGLESRVPILDHRIVEFAWQLPMRMKIREGQNKWLLKQVLYKHVPPALMDRPKSGFGIPIHEWLRGPLREWGEELLDANRIRHEGFFAPEPIREKWDQHQSGKFNWAYPLWNVLMFQAWLEEERKERHEFDQTPVASGSQVY